MAELVLQNVQYRYAGSERLALNDVNCRFVGGAFHAVIGPSGSGKTTLLSIMAGLDRPSAGSVLVSGTDLATMDLDAYRRQRVAIIFQAFQLFPLLTAQENVAFTMELNGADKKAAAERAGDLLAAVDILGDTQKRQPSNLSGGEQQRVAIARALGSGAEIILADEPTGNLDTENSQRVIEILARLAHEQGYCVVVVTHDPAIAAAADRVYRMTDGVLTLER